MLNSSTLKQIWLIVERNQALILLELSDNDLIRRIQQQLESQGLLSDSELNATQNYLKTRVLLIRDFAESRLCAL